MFFMESSRVETLMKLNDGLFAFINVELFPIIQKEVSVSAIDSVWFAAEKEIMAFITVFAQKDNLAGNERKGFANFTNFGSNLLDASFGLVLLVS